ncbi:F-box/LRR-repeat protein 20-like [Oppia nitens]|uniref:F-box/LRR-repeat protein 20-like n=1 Tax=Oppia nitens TaxID=1686743 RepID=UPI0023DC546E|nr:F-box/LRR-repeat protein 20-like [Oppia nitens]
MAKRLRSSRQSGGDCRRYQYDLRSKAKRLKREDKDVNLNDNQLINGQNCEELSDLNESNMSQTLVIHKFTKMPNKSYNLRRRGAQNNNKSGRRSGEKASTLTINHLPDDCLLEIFDKLTTIHDKLALQRVSLRFEQLVFRLLRAQKLFTVGSTFGENSDQMLTKAVCSSVIKKCPNLQVFKMPGFYTKTNLNLYNSRVGDREMSKLATSCPDLRELDICGCGNVTEVGINHVITGCKKIEKLSISFCHEVTGISLGKLTKNFKTLSLNTNDKTPPLMDCLRSLTNGSGKFITELNICAYNELYSQDNILKLICNDLPLLQTLRYSIPSKGNIKYGMFGLLTNLTDLVFDCNSFNLTDTEMIKIMTGCNRLKYLFIRYETIKDFNTLTDYSLRKLPQFCPNLEKFYFHAKDAPLQSATDSMIECFNQFPRLEVLSLKSFENISDDSVISLIQSCPTLSSIYLLNCNKVTNATIDALIVAAKSQPNKRYKYEIRSTQMKTRKKKLPVNLIDCSKN